MKLIFSKNKHTLSKKYTQRLTAKLHGEKFIITRNFKIDTKHIQLIFSKNKYFSALIETYTQRLAAKLYKAIHISKKNFN